MKTSEIRKKFLDHMAKNGHVIIPSSRLTPENDPTTLFTGSGMQPMLPYLLGQPHPLGKRIADSQKCFRSQDIEEVGDNRHTTFFEMLGNWSLGDFFKKEQIDMMWEFLVEDLKLDPSRLYFSCFEGSAELNIPRDTESYNIWAEKLSAKGLNPERQISYYPEKKNWWSRSGVPANMPIGEPGGADTEMFFDFDPEYTKEGKQINNRLNIHDNSEFKWEKCHPNCDCGRFMEIGNNVFMEYQKTEKGFEVLPQKNVDFGGGLERIAAASIADPDVFNIDIFDGPKYTLETLSKKKYGADKKTTYAMRVIMDHLRAATFLVGDDVLPGNKDQMYFVRRLIRRAVRFARDLNINENFTANIVNAFIDRYAEAYPNLKEKEEFIRNTVRDEETKFRKTLENGIKEFEKIPGDISGEQAFNLLQSFGFPVELTEELAKEKNKKVDLETFAKLKEEHTNASRAGSEKKFKGGLGGDSEMEVKYHTATHLLHEALHQVLGENVLQKGSNITPERLRFDFAFDRKMTADEIKKVEDTVNDVIGKKYTVTREEISKDEAVSRGAIGLFGEKYGDIVSIYHIGAGGKKRGDNDLFSIEFCGGPHVTNTGDLGVFKIIKEEAVSAGVRRIKAILE
jgi:alanyl-tRNA synthetase